MRYLRQGLMALITALMLVVLPVASWAQEPGPGPGPDGDVDLAEFYEGLQPYGEWIDHPRFGSVWSPYVQEQEADWRPYTRGRWILTDEHGWYWDSEEPFGWAVYHYGRWFNDPESGWLWIPGTVWGPAWVAWRNSEDVVGWAPLPPEAAWSPDADPEFATVYLDGPRYASMWVFVGAGALLAPRVYRYFYPPSRNTFYMGRSRYITSYSYGNRRVFNRGIDPRFIERRIGRPVARLPLRTFDSPRALQAPGQRNFVGVYRPQFAPRGDGRPSRPAFVAPRAPVALPPGGDRSRPFDRTPGRDTGFPRPDGGRIGPDPRRDTGPAVRTTPGFDRERDRERARLPEPRREAAPPPRIQAPEPRREVAPPPRIVTPEARPERGGGFRPPDGRREFEPRGGDRGGRPPEARREASPEPRFNRPAPDVTRSREAPPPRVSAPPAPPPRAAPPPTPPRAAPPAEVRRAPPPPEQRKERRPEDKDKRPPPA